MSQVLLEEARNRTALSERQAGAGVESSRQVFIVNFNDEAYLNQSFTSDIKKWEEALDRTETEGGTAMRDALSMSMDYLKEKAKKDKKVLVAITDGNDTTSINISLEDLMRKAQQSDALIYSISIVSEEEPRAVKKARRALHDLAAASGAMDYYHKDLEDVDRIVPEVANEIRHQYTRAYSPLNPALDGIFRKITVTVNAPGRPDARSRNGYYANAFVKK